MQKLDFLSASPSIYILNNARWKSKLGGFLSLVYILVMLMITIYYLYIYFSGKQYKLEYLINNYTGISEKDRNSIYRKPMEFFLLLERINYGDSKIHIELNKGPNLYDESNITKCNDLKEIDSNGAYFCFNMTVEDEFNLICTGNCTNVLGGPFLSSFLLFSRALIIDHNKKEPLSNNDELFSLSFLPVYTTKNSFLLGIVEYTPIIYKSTKIFNKEDTIYYDKYMSNIEYVNIENSIREKDIFFQLRIEPSTNFDIYIREYITLIDTLSKIGGLFSPIKVFFSMLLLFYSNSENNFQIVKNIIN